MNKDLNPSGTSTNSPRPFGSSHHEMVLTATLSQTISFSSPSHPQPSPPCLSGTGTPRGPAVMAAGPPAQRSRPLLPRAPGAGWTPPRSRRWPSTRSPRSQCNLGRGPSRGPGPAAWNAGPRRPRGRIPSPVWSAVLRWCRPLWGSCPLPARSRSSVSSAEGCSSQCACGFECVVASVTRKEKCRGWRRLADYWDKIRQLWLVIIKLYYICI